MAWKRKPMPTISGYESLGDDVRAKRFLDFKLNQLLTTEDPVWEFRDEFASRGEVVNFVIERFEYPIVRGVPNDKHTMNWFGGRECYTITADYWQDAAETLRTLILSEKREGRGAKGMGDCEDTSVLLVDLFLERGWGAWECLGRVYRGSRLLGGHGWPLVQDERGGWRLVESTLDEPKPWPDGYPRVNPAKNDWRVGDLRYRADVRFNRTHYYEWGRTIDSYLAMEYGEKETREKYREIERAWRSPVKPLRRAGLLSRLRWRRRR